MKCTEYKDSEATITIQQVITAFGWGKQSVEGIEGNLYEYAVKID